MDTSEHYIKMCEKAEEIQSQADYERAGDFFYCLGDGEVDANFNDYEYGWLYDKEDIWLPRQDQLQAMVMEYWWGDEQPVNNICEMLHEFYWWEDESTSRPQSMEQLWLGFVMKELYSKQWEGETWKHQNN